MLRVRPLPEVRSRAALALCAALCCAASAPAWSAQDAPQAGEPDAPELDVSLFAAAGEGAAGSVRIGWGELDRVLLDKYAMTSEGRDALQHLLRARLLEKLAREARLEVQPAEVEERLADFEEQVQSAGEAPDLDAYLARQRIDREMLREFMRMGIVQERLTARALGRGAGQPVSAEEQEMWLDQIMLERGVDYPEPPWESVVARCGDLSVGLGEYARHLRIVLPEEDLRDACRHLVLARVLRERMPDLSDAAVERAVAEELERRRAFVRENPAYQGLTYEQVASSRGTQPASLERDPELLATALSHLWVDRKYTEEGLQQLYKERRRFFDDRFGEALECYALFLNAAELPNALVPRRFDEARRELEKLAPQLTSLDAFQTAVARYSEAPDARESKGALGWLTRAGEVPEVLRDAVFARHSGGVDSAKRLVGPVDMPGGVALVWVEGWRAAPDWATMRSYVHRELRRVFVQSALPAEDLVTYLDVK